MRVFVSCFGPEESARSIEASIIATLQDVSLCPEDATAITTKLRDLSEVCVALCAMCRIC